jgi:hypothetical protein
MTPAISVLVVLLLAAVRSALRAGFAVAPF